MKLFSVIFCILFSIIAIAQQEHFVPKDKWSKDLYISDAFCAGKGLKPGETNELLRAWNSEAGDNVFTRVVDIRWYFSSPAEAAAYLNGNIRDLSEKGDVITTKVDISNVENLRIYREGGETRAMNEALGLKSNMYFFLFTIKNYVAKVFVSSDNMTLEEAATYAKESAKRLNAAVR